HLMDFQSTVEVEIFQGENAIADQNVPLGSFKIEGLPSKPAGEVEIEVHFDFDLNGILIVTAKEKSGGSQESLTVNNAAVERLSSKALKQSQLELDSLFASAAAASAATLDVETEDGEEIDGDGEEE
ncbi:MAG: Hsp70 family protein, partial [Synechococcales cyanobacterium RM1_1_8]|nr:Hsp70 family protein [Synechococcales cyanobacterium RM1_1_8]